MRTATTGGTAAEATRDPQSRRARTALFAGAVGTSVLAVTIGVLFSGAVDPSPLLDPGPLVRWGLPLVTVLVHLCSMVTVGGLTLCATVLRPRTAMWDRAADLSTGAAIGWAVAQAVHLVLYHATVVGEPIGGSEYLDVLAQFIVGVELGSILAWAVVLSAATVVMSALCSRPAGAGWAAVVACVALMPLSGLGHASGAGNHELAVAAMWLHQLGVAWWAGGLFVLLIATRAGSAEAATATSRYSTIAGWAVSLVLFSGAASAWTRVDDAADLVETTWGRLLVVKLLAFLVLGFAGWRHRRATLPLLRRSDGRTGPFRRLAAVEVLVMAGTVGISVSLGAAQPPVPQEEVSENAVFSALPPPWFDGLVTQTRVDPLFLFLSAAGVWVYILWVRRLRARGDGWPPNRTVCWLGAMLLLAWTLNGGPSAYGEAVFSAHMLQHMMLIAVIPIFTAQAAPISLALRALPRRTDGSLGPRELLLSVLHARWAQFFAVPAVASLNAVVSMAVFYFSPLFEFAMGSHVAHSLMIVHFALIGYLFTNAVIGKDPGPRRPPYPLRLILLLPSTVFHTFFGLFLTSAGSLLAEDHFRAFDVPWADPATDQQAAGAIAWAFGEIPVVVLAVVVAAQWAAHDDRVRRRGERRLRRDQRDRRAAAPSRRGPSPQDEAPTGR